jgi:hypothetical protein
MQEASYATEASAMSIKASIHPPREAFSRWANPIVRVTVDLLEVGRADRRQSLARTPEVPLLNAIVRHGQ